MPIRLKIDRKSLTQPSHRGSRRFESSVEHFITCINQVHFGQTYEATAKNPTLQEFKEIGLGTSVKSQ
jgi:hypothetical protein